jgi:hypothetical protein
MKLEEKLNDLLSWYTPQEINEKLWMWFSVSLETEPELSHDPKENSSQFFMYQKIEEALIYKDNEGLLPWNELFSWYHPLTIVNYLNAWFCGFVKSECWCEIMTPKDRASHAFLLRELKLLINCNISNN